jgi:hypothetical protein
MEAYQSFSSGGTGNGNVDLTNVSSDIIPSNNNSYSLGNSVRQWKDLWVSNSTIYLNSLPITADGANLKVNGNTVLTTSSPLSFSNLSVTGNVTANAVYTNNYFYANGAPFPQGSNSLPGTTISLKDNVIATTTLNQNLVLSANGVGNVQTNSSIMPDATQVRDIGSASNKFNSIYAGYYYGNGSQLTGISAGNSNSIISGNSNVKIVSAGGNVTIGIGGIGNIVVVSGAGEYVTGVVSASGNITAPYFVGNGSLLTGITTVAAANTAQTVTANAQANITSVGTLTSLSVTGTVQGGNILTSGIVSTTGNITGNYFIGNGSQLTGLPAIYGNANVVANLAALGSNPVSTTGNVTGGNLVTGAQVVASGVIQTGTGFSTGGYLSVDGDTDLHKTTVTGNLSVTGNITANVGSFFVGNGSQLTGLAATYGNSNVVANLAALGSNPVSTTGNITSGNLLTGGLISVAGNIAGGNLSGTNITGTLITAAQANITTVGTLGNLAVSGQANITQQINTARVSATGNITVGNVLTGGLISATGNVSGNFFIGNGSALTGITASANTGNVTFNDQAVVGTGNPEGGGGLYLAPGTESVANLQYWRVRGGDVATHMHLDTGNNAYFDQYFGDDGKYVKLVNTGNVVISSDDATGNSAQWTFDTTGNLTLPLGSIVYETNIPDQSLSGSAIALKPIGGTTANQQLLIYPTANDGDHIHMTSGNLYTTELFLGSDNFYVKLANTGNVVINSNDAVGNSAQWIFDASGDLTVPGNLVINGLTNVFGSNVALLQSNPDLPLLSVSSGSNGGLSSLWVEDYANASTSNIAAVYVNPTPGSGNVRIATGNNGGAGPNLWDFTPTGNLSAPGAISAVGNITANVGSFFVGNGSLLTGIAASSYGNANVVANLAALGSNPISTTGNVSGNYFIGNGSQLSSVATQVTGSWTLAAGTNTVSLSVPGPGTYSIWVNGNIPNGIVVYTATIVVTNNNVPVVGSSYG